MIEDRYYIEPAVWSVDLAPLRSDGGIDLATLAFSLLLRPHAGGGG